MKRRDKLLPDNIRELKDDATRAFRAAIRRADPALAMRDALTAHPIPQPAHGHKTIVLAIGKAAPAMLRAIMPILTGPRILVCVTHRENNEQLPGVEVFRAGHPIPDIIGAQGAERIVDILKEAQKDDTVLALISGGGSALLPAPPEGISLEDKQKLNRHLLESGLDIVSMNLIRQQVSLLKGGGMARLASPAQITAYILSDVVGDDLRAIASGPTVAPIGTAQEAQDILQKNDLLKRIPESIQHYLQMAPLRTSQIISNNHLIGSNRESVHAAADALQSRYETQIIETPLTGDVNNAASEIFRILRNTKQDRPKAILWGGETTVNVRGKGRGGRNQELALRLAALADAEPLNTSWTFLSAGTDGRDGPTDAAGAIVDQQTLPRIKEQGQAPTALLDRNDSYTALHFSGDLLVTGATGTNVADIQIALVN